MGAQCFQKGQDLLITIKVGREWGEECILKKKESTKIFANSLIFLGTRGPDLNRHGIATEGF